MSAFNIWRENPPPRETVLWVRYDLTDKQGWQLARTCKRGCCISMGFGSMVLPKFWKDAMPDEAAAFDNLTFWETRAEFDAALAARKEAGE